jgi:hypothetical protein
MPASFRPTLELLEDRCTPAAIPVQSPLSVAVADLQHTLIHGQILASQIETAGVQAVIHLEQQAAPLLHGQLGIGLMGDILVHQATLAGLQQQGATLAAQDVATDAGSFPILRALVPAAK